MNTVTKGIRLSVNTFSKINDPADFFFLIIKIQKKELVTEGWIMIYGGNEKNARRED